jgi:hypothetical protein
VYDRVISLHRLLDEGFIANVASVNPKARRIDREVAHLPGGEIIENAHLEVTSDQGVHYVASDESGASGHEDPRELHLRILRVGTALIIILRNELDPGDVLGPAPDGLIANRTAM